MNAITILRNTQSLGAREFRQKLDTILRHPYPCRVMLHNKPALTVLPDNAFLSLLEILEDLKDSGFLNKTQKRLASESRKKHPWFWSKTWQKKEREVDRELKVGRIKKANSVEDFLKELKSKT